MNPHILILDGTAGSDIKLFLTQIYKGTPPCTMMLYDEWISTHAICSHHDQHPDGIVYIRVSPEIAFKRIQKQYLPSIQIPSLDDINKIYQNKEDLFTEKKHLPAVLQNIPILILNGNIDFQTDFSQFYNHLFYIKKFIQQIQDKKDQAQGIFKSKAPHRHCC